MGGVLVVEDDKSLRDILKRKLKAAGHPVEATGSGKEAKNLIETVRAMKNGAYDFIQKPFNFEILEVSINKALKEKKLEDENKTLKKILKKRGNEFVLETRSEKFRELLKTLETAAQTDASILLRGETGTGKEVLASYVESFRYQFRLNYFASWKVESSGE